MAASVNKVILIGNLGRDPELRTFPSGGQVANVTIATTHKWKDRQTGDPREETEWHRLVFNGRLAEIVGQYLRKGNAIYVEGRLRTRKWQGQDGQDRYTTEIMVNQMQMLGGRSEASGGGDWGGSSVPRAAPQAAPAAASAPSASGASQPMSAGFDEGFDEDIPF